MSLETRTTGTTPLTVPQKLRLLLDCVPGLFFSVVAGVYLTWLQDVYGGPKPAILLFLGLIILVTGHRAVQRLRDVMSGVALVREDLLQNVLGRGSQRRRPDHHTGEFAGLGRLRMTPASFRQAIRGRRHRVTYSPASRIAWSLEPLN